MLGKIIHFTLLLIGVCIHIIHSNFKNLYMYTRLRHSKKISFFNRSVFFFYMETFFSNALKSLSLVKSLLRMYSNTRNA